jgi:glutamine transport system permease protein
VLRLFVLKGEVMNNFQFKAEVMLDSIPLLLEGAQLTIIITALGLFFGFFIGCTFGFMKLSRKFFLQKFAGGYIEAIRGTPLMVQVMFLYFGLPLLIGMRLDPFVAGVIAISVNSGAYIAEVVRGAVQSIPTGQMEAGRSIGLSHAKSMRYIIWPQALRIMIPPLGNQFIISLKDTSLLVVIGVSELTRKGTEIVADTFRAFEVWLTVAIVYLCITMVLSKVLKILEKKLLQD